mgnify:CR=1 FL=1
MLLQDLDVPAIIGARTGSALDFVLARSFEEDPEDEGPADAFDDEDDLIDDLDDDDDDDDLDIDIDDDDDEDDDDSTTMMRTTTRGWMMTSMRTSTSIQWMTARTPISDLNGTTKSDREKKGDRKRPPFLHATDARNATPLAAFSGRVARSTAEDLRHGAANGFGDPFLEPRTSNALAVDDQREVIVRDAQLGRSLSHRHLAKGDSCAERRLAFKRRHRHSLLPRRCISNG